VPDLLSDLLKTAGQFATFMQQSAPGVPERVWREVAPWLQHLVSRAPLLWIPIISSGFECEVLYPDRRSPTGWVGCSNRAVTVCDCCGHRACLHHCRIDANGEAICFECVALARQAASEHPRHPPKSDPRRPNQDDYPPGAQGRQQTPPGVKKPEMTQKQALRVLGLTAEADEDAIRTAHKRLSFEWHPDRHKTDAAKARAEAKFKQIQVAFRVLTEPPKR